MALKRERDPELVRIHQINIRFSKHYIDLLKRDSKNEKYLGNSSELVRDIIEKYYRENGEDRGE